MFSIIKKRNATLKENKKNKADQKKRKATLKESKENKADQKKRKKDIQNIKAQIDDAYKEWCDEYDEDADFVCTAIPTSEPLQGKLLLKPVNEILNKPLSCWNNDDLMPIAKLLSGRPYIDGSGDNFEGASAFHSIMPDFDSYLDEHDDIRGIVDPIYVIAEIGAIVLPQVVLNNYPPANSPLPQLVNWSGLNYCWIFNGRNRASNSQHLVGWLQNAVNGLRLMVFNTNSPGIYY